jgi:hypothetical protein
MPGARWAPNTVVDNDLAKALARHRAGVAPMLQLACGCCALSPTPDTHSSTASIPCRFTPDHLLVFKVSRAPARYVWLAVTGYVFYSY